MHIAQQLGPAPDQYNESWEARVSEFVERLDKVPEDRLAVDPVPVLADTTGARWLRRHLPSAVVVVTTRVDGRYRAATVGSCISVSLDPPLILISIERDTQMESWLESSGVFGVNSLPWDQQFPADQFAGFAPLASSSFANIDHFVSISGVPILTASIAWADCKIVQSTTTGDHRCFVGEILALGEGRGDPDDPLMYHLSRYRRLR